MSDSLIWMIHIFSAEKFNKMEWSIQMENLGTIVSLYRYMRGGWVWRFNEMTWSFVEICTSAEVCVIWVCWKSSSDTAYMHGSFSSHIHSIAYTQRTNKFFSNIKQFDYQQFHRTMDLENGDYFFFGAHNKSILVVAKAIRKLFNYNWDSFHFNWYKIT